METRTHSPGVPKLTTCLKLLTTTFTISRSLGWLGDTSVREAVHKRFGGRGDSEAQ